MKEKIDWKALGKETGIKNINATKFVAWFRAKYSEEIMRNYDPVTTMQWYKNYTKQLIK